MSSNIAVLFYRSWPKWEVLNSLGDFPQLIEMILEGASLRSTVLKAAHHGGCTSTTPEFLEAVNPQVVVISVGADNDFGHPCAGVLERLSDVLTYRTDEDGVVEVTSDGVAVWVEPEQ